MLPLLASVHDGIAYPRTGPEGSDVALFVAAALGIWIVRRALRRRMARTRASGAHRED